MKNTVFDSYALLAFIFDEPGADQVADTFKLALQDKKRIFMCTVNWSETMYITIRAKSKNAWKSTQSHLRDLPIQLVEADIALSEVAAEFKASCEMSLADAYAAALTKVKKAELVTGDPAFEALKQTLKHIVWLDQ